MTTKTPRYGWDMPDPGGSPNTWGDILNGTTGKVDEQVYQNALAGVPIGGIVMFAGAVAPPNYLLCNGQVYSNTAIPKLWPVLNNAYNAGTSAVAGTSSAVPNVNQKLPLGAGSSNPLGSTGGSFTYTLTAAQLPAHTHPVTDPTHAHTASQVAHAHSDTGHVHDPTGSYQDAHAHNLTKNPVSNFAGANVQAGSGWAFGDIDTDPMQPGLHITINPGFANLDNRQPAVTVDAHATGVTVGANTGGGAAATIVPPYVALNYVIRYQ